MMKRMIKRCAGLDVHQATVVACVLIHEGRKSPRSEAAVLNAIESLSRQRR
jgi:hypothetical protein